MQGEERDIVILSLVRSNADGRDGSGAIGFVSSPNRINVALSRARHGLYVFGNMALMEHKSDLWLAVADVARSRGQVGPGLVLQCPSHPDSEPITVCSPADFSRAPLGGCSKLCAETLTCGHPCRLLCHSTPHSIVVCSEPCARDRPPGCLHPCSSPCGVDPCPPCPTRVTKRRDKCGHSSSQWQISMHVENIKTTVSMVGARL